MERDYGVTPKPAQYACVIDLLGRAGKLVEAIDMVNKMPFKPHPAIFGTLLGACRIYKNLGLAEFAATNLLDCDPTSADGYVQLANVYAEMDKWEPVYTVRKSMRENKVKSAVHEFRSVDRIHPELEYMHEKLNDLEKKLKLAGYVANLDFVLHDVGEEQKQQLLLWHSKKLAIAYG